MTNSQTLSQKISKLDPVQKVRKARAIEEKQRRAREERSRYFVPVKPGDKNSFLHMDVVSNDQQAFINSTADERWVFGGNRSGKTEVAVQDCIMFCTGVHPVRSKHRQVPVKVRYCAPKWRDGIVGVIHQKFKECVRRDQLRGGSWEKAYVDKEHRLYFKNGSFIHFKSGEEDLDTYGGTDLDACYQDERLSESRKLENTMRLADRNGYYVGAMTPEMGITWEEDHVLEPDEGVVVDHWFFSSYGNPHLSAEGLKKVKAGIKDKLKVDAKIWGLFVPLQGLVLPQWNKDIHIVPDFVIPEYWPRVFVIDTHHKTPCAAMWCAWSPEGEIIVYRTIKKKLTVPEWQIEIRVNSIGEKISLWMGDEPGGGEGENIFGKASVVKEFNKGTNAIPLVAINDVSDKSFQAGVYKMWDYLGVDPISHKSKIKVFESCNTPVEYINGKACGSLPWEMRRYQYKKEQKADEETLREKVRLVHNHYIDDLRYVIMAGPVVHVGSIKSAIGDNWS